ncbi:MAG: hypothetical protein GY841_22900, partial [FCB group bacterium]|nr:hypothetical protein [FCB group bacterium]
EKVQSTFNYNFDGDQIKTVTDFTYTNDALTQSDTYRNNVITSDIAVAQRDVLRSVSVYTGNEGEEKVQSTFNYNFDGDQIKTVTDFTYTNDALTQSDTYRNNIATGDIALAERNVLRSVSVYTGNEGEEKVQTTYNYNFDGDQIKTVTEFTYEADALTQSDTYRNNTITAVIGEATKDVLRSVSVYTGNEGEEKVQSTFNYNFDGDQIKTV